jgi:aspartyl-tRNA synthetase
VKAPRANRYRDRWAGQLRADSVDEHPRVAGWVHRRRDHGGLIFIDLRDRTGLLQLVFRPEEAPEAHAAAGRLRAEDVISAGGELLRREEGTVNPNLPTGEIELAVSDFELLADAAAALPLSRPAQGAHARHDGAAPRRGQGDSRPSLGGGLSRDRDADPHALDTRGRA